MAQPAASLTVSPAAPARGSVVTATYSVQGNSGSGQTITFSGSVAFGGATYPGVTGAFAIPGTAAAVAFAVPTGAGLVFAKTASPAVWTAVVPASGVSGAATVTGSVVVGGSTFKPTAKITLPAVPVTPVIPAAGTVPYPAALASGHTLTGQYLPADLYAWRYAPGTTTPVVNGGGVTENPDSPRNVSVTTDGGLSVLRLAVTSDSDCGVIQSPGTFPTSSGVIETLVRFSGTSSGGSDFFADWASFWLYGDGWPAGGEIDAVETQYGNSFVSYHYGSGGSSTATDNPWTYAGKTVQLTPENTTSVPAAPNILPDTWTYVTLAFGRDASGNYKVDIYYNGALYRTIDGPFVTGAPMYITAGTAFGASGLGSGQAPFDQPGAIEIQYIRVFS